MWQLLVAVQKKTVCGDAQMSLRPFFPGKDDKLCQLWMQCRLSPK
jgi:hypothetical protein